ncbi:DUF4179 domain-containing protein [Lachnospiraceae bacterium OF09-6]|nr:DUF4179 domain-containing protein [Lachnospiraceae bacterium OF09-6]
MSKNDTIYTLQQDIEIPDIVAEKANEAFEQIRNEAKKKGDKVVTYQKPVKRSKKKYAMIALAATLAVGTATAYAAYTGWSKGLKEELRISEEQQKNLEENGMAAFSDASVTDVGVTVTAQQSITDNYYTYLSFKVDGYSVEKGVQPGFENISVTVDGKDDISWGGSFYNGTVSDENGMAVKADGSELETEADGSIIENYVMDDGSLEYHMVLAKSDEKGFFIGKKLHVEFQNLGSLAKADYTPDIEGTWALDMTLGGSDESRYTEVTQDLGNSGATVTSVELSPVSIRVTYDFPRVEQTEEYEDENGEMQIFTSYAEAPFASGLKLKDGSTIMNLYGGPGTAGYVDEESNTYISGYAFDRVIDPSEVEAVLFRKETTNGDTETEEPEYYEVAVK